MFSRRRPETQQHRFISTVSHEIRSPLHAISTAAALLPEAGPLNSEQHELLQMVDSGANHVRLPAPGFSSSHLRPSRLPALLPELVRHSRRSLLLSCPYVSEACPYCVHTVCPRISVHRLW